MIWKSVNLRIWRQGSRNTENHGEGVLLGIKHDGAITTSAVLVLERCDQNGGTAAKIKLTHLNAAAQHHPARIRRQHARFAPRGRVLPGPTPQSRVVAPALC